MKEQEDIRIESENLKGFVKKLVKKYPDIRPHGEDDWDWNLADEGFDFLESGDLPFAEYMFEQLIVSQPDFFEGYEGLALSYQANGRKKEAVLLIDHAVKLARKFLDAGGLNEEALDEILAEQEQIHSM